jgi:uncharacterized surface protein with fasciclin (FAS1) repeats
LRHFYPHPARRSGRQIAQAALRSRVMTATHPLRRTAAATIAIAALSMTLAAARASATSVPPGEGSAPAGECSLYDPAVVSGLPVTEAASEIDELATFSAAVAASSLHDQLAGAGPLTIFAPSNDAFSRIPTNVFDAILADTDLLDSILSVHVVAGRALSPEELAAAGTVDALTGPVAVTVEGDVLVLNGGEARVACAGIMTADATVYIIDQVLQPPMESACPGGSSVPGSSTPGGSVPMASVPDSSVPGSSVPPC